VTGTNGKTSVASFTRQIWEALGERAVNFGTTGVEGAVAAPLSHTTPEPITLHALLADLADQGVTHAAMEASSHGLDQARLDGVRLEAAAFTNITRDHLDYHPDFEAYFNAKVGLFTRVLPRGGTAVVNLDDAHGPAVRAAAIERGQRVITVGRDEGCDLRLIGQRFDATGQDVLFSWEGRNRSARLDLIGGFQAHNALVAAGLAIGSGSDADAVLDALPALRTVRGRMERAATRSNGAAVFVDYSHTPDALKTALEALRPHVMGRLLVVFGAGGDRDRGKRPLMGQAAAQAADLVFVTDDNPRTEDAAAIRAAIMAGCPDATAIGDRAEAILTAVDALQPGDALLVAGKGHETGQIVGHDVLPFDDIEQASVAVAALDGLGA
jgi:UDP-N-acetylmuramoyl-L-alanyl-D-glutamate--2,6-diaminopimelate ligase